MTAVSRRSRGYRVLASLNGDGRFGLALVAIVAWLLLPALAGDAGRSLWRYERSGLAAHEYWRLLTAHWVHLGLTHAVLNAMGLALMWALFARDFRPWRWVVIVGASMAAIDAGLWYLAPEVDWYVGASGWLHGVMAAGTLAHLRRGDLDGWILALFLIVKLALEHRGPLPFAGNDPVVVQAHLYGTLGGLAAALCLPSRREPL